MIGIRKSDQPLLDAAGCATRADRKTVRAAIKQSEALSTGSGVTRAAEFILSLAARLARSNRKRA